MSFKELPAPNDRNCLLGRYWQPTGELKHSASAGPSRVSAHSTAIIPQDCTLQGEITIGQGVIIHPKASILATQGPIILGEDCVVEEMAVIMNSKETLRIGKENQFMAASRVAFRDGSFKARLRAGIEALSIGDNNTFHPRSAVSGVHISNNCSIAAGSILLPFPGVAEPERLPEGTTVFGAGADRAIWDGAGDAAERAVKDGQREYLREILPK